MKHSSPILNSTLTLENFNLAMKISPSQNRNQTDREMSMSMSHSPLPPPLEKLTLTTTFQTYFRLVFNTLFYLGWSPFYIKKIKNVNSGLGSSSSSSLSFSKSYEENWLQKVICAFIQTLVVIFMTSMLLGSLNIPLEAEPTLIYLLVGKLTMLVYLIAFIWLVWTKQEKISRTFGAGGLPSLKEKLIICVPMTLPILCYGGAFFGKLVGVLQQVSKDPSTAWLLFGEMYLPPLNYPFNSTKYMLKNMSLNTGERVLAISSCTLWTLHDFMSASCNILIFLNIFAVYQLLTEGIRRMDALNRCGIQAYVSLFVKTSSMIGTQNEIFGNLALAYFCYQLASLTGTFIFIGGETKIPFVIRGCILVNFCYVISVMVWASHVSNLGAKFKSLFLSKTEYRETDTAKDPGVQLILTRDDGEDLDLLPSPKSVSMPNEAFAERQGLSLSSSFIAYLEMTEGNLGVCGGGFFTFSFGFLGQALTFIFTFILVMIQIIQTNPLRKPEGVLVLVDGQTKN